MMTAMLGHAYDLSVAEDGVIKHLPVCIAEGKRVTYSASRIEVWKRSVMVAVADRDLSGNPVVYYDPVAFSDAPPAFQLWVLEHECHHHLKGDTKSMGFSPMNRMARERAADMYATRKIIRTHGLLDPHIADIYNTVVDEDYHTRHLPPQLKFQAFSHKSREMETQKRALFFRRQVEAERRKTSFGYRRF